MRCGIRFVAVLIGLAFSAAGLTGCSLGGYLIGSLIDGSTPLDRSKALPPSSLLELSPGDSVGLNLTNGKNLTGQLKTITQENGATYHDRCLRYRDQSGVPGGLPVPGDSVWIRGHAGEDPFDMRGEFVRYDTPGLWSVRMPRELVLTPYSMIDTVRFGEAGVVIGSSLREAALNGWLPTPRCDLVVASSEGRRGIPLDSVSAVNIPLGENPRNARWWGLGIGVVVDIAILAGTLGYVSAMNNLYEGGFGM